MKYISLALFIICITSFIVGCKYEDGPWISLRSADKRVEGTYRIQKFYYNGADSTLAIQSKPCYGLIEFTSDEEIRMNKGSLCSTQGDWVLTNGNYKLVVRFLGNFEGIPPWSTDNEATYDILELRDDEMTIYTVFGNNTIKIELSE
ncbi:MAG TPA: lipocalin family protein [Bacteroidia bacterium]|nr:lipocalin family protein [Bacteroidia bacterium]